MAAQTAVQNKFRSYLGGALVALGTAASLVSFGSFALHLQGLMERSGEQYFGFLPAVGLAFLHTTQSLAFGQTGLFFVLAHILVLFLAPIAVVVGFALRRRSRPSQQNRSLGWPCIY